MKLASVDIFRFRLPLTYPVSLKGVPHSSREGLLIRVKDQGGAEGWGEIAPLPRFSSETLDEALAEAKVIASHLQNAPNGASPGTLPSVRFGFELALNSLHSSRSPVHHLRSPGEAVALCRLLFGTTAQVIAEARQLKEKGFLAAKIKVGQRPVKEDAELIREVAAEIKGLMLRLDANGAWSLSEAEEFFRSLEDTRIDFIEEPLADRRNLSTLAGRCSIPIALDETLRTPEALEFLPLAKVLVLKPSLMGRVNSLTEFANSARGNGKRCVISSAWETGIGTNGLLRLASSLPGEIHGLDTYRYLRHDVLFHALQLDAPIAPCPEYILGEGDINMSLLEHV